MDPLLGRVFETPDLDAWRDESGRRAGRCPGLIKIPFKFGEKLNKGKSTRERNVVVVGISRHVINRGD